MIGTNWRSPLATVTLLTWLTLTDLSLSQEGLRSVQH